MTRHLLLSLCPLAALAAEPVLVSDGETTDHWRGVTLVDDGKVGAHAVRYDVPAGRPAGPSFDHRQLGLDFTHGGELRFWYRFTGQGSSSLAIKVLAFPFADGMQATWFITQDAPGDGQWHRAVVDLASEHLSWGDRPDRDGRLIMFRTDGAGGSKLTLDLDDVVIAPTRFTAALTAIRFAAAGSTAELKLGNPGTEPVTLVITGGAEPLRLELPAGASESRRLALPPDPAWLARAKPLDRARVRVRVAPADAPDQAKEVDVVVVKPLDLPPHPRLLLSDAEIPAMQDRIAKAAWAKAAWEGLLKSADDWLARAVVLPPRGGQWWHWYACKKDGARLQTVSPTEHKCPVCGTVYTGWPYDDVVLDRDHNALAGGLRTLGVVYRVTRDARYAAKAREILLAYAARYDSYPLHNVQGKPSVGGGKVGPQTLDESTWLIPMCQGADLIWDTLSDADRQTAADGLFRPAAQVIRNHRMGIHNIQCWKNSAVGLVGLLLDDPELVSDAVKSDHGFEQQIARGVSVDGQWYEGAWGYHFYTMSAIAPLTEAGERCGLGLYAYEHDGRSFRRLFEGPLDLAMPDLRLPAFNDSGTQGIKGSRLYELALARYGEARFAEVLQGTARGGLEGLLVGVEPLPDPPAEANVSRNFNASGYAVLRSGPDVNATWACLKYGPHGGGHGHPDKLNVVLYARGSIVGVDPGTGLYGVPLHKEWQRASIAHNTLTIDEQNQAEATGRCLAFGTTADIAAAAAEAGPIHKGVRYRRAVALVGPNLVLVLDQVTSADERTFDLAWHTAGEWAETPAGAPVPMPDKDGYKHLRDVVVAPGELPLVKATDALSVGLAVASAEPGETWACTGAGANDEERVPCVIRRVKGQTAVVGWVLSLDGQRPAVSIADGALAATVGEKAYRLAMAEDGSLTVTAEGREWRVSAP
ncbi:MAG: heparinase II/III family protein [Armatimonadetes bacterium]|nr:heparinase II/III family protein [Armatimonadota bacterium]